MNRLRASLLEATVLALAAACGLSAPDARAQGASPPPGKALVVLYRADKQPVAARVPVIANADRLGDLGNLEFIRAVVNPGRTFLRVGDRVLTTLAIQTSANQTSYVLVEAIPGLTPVRVDLRETNEAFARRALSQSRPAAAGAGVAAAAGAGVAAAAPRAAPAPAPAAPAPRAPAAAPARAQPAPPLQPAPPPPPQRQAQAAPKPAPPPPAPSPEQPSEWSFALIAKTGAFKLSSVSQTVGGLPTTYKKASKPVAGVEAEMRRDDGYALGVELFYYKNDFTPDGTALQGQQTVYSTTFNAKYYFEATSWLYPFLGAGLGYAAANFGGDFTGKAGGVSFQGMLGADIRFSDYVGLYLEYKYLVASPRDSNSQQITTSGTGILAGLSFAF
jgi:opacity protein-like surface antigen